MMAIIIPCIMFGIFIYNYFGGFVEIDKKLEKHIIQTMIEDSSIEHGARPLRTSSAVRVCVIPSGNVIHPMSSDGNPEITSVFLTAAIETYSDGTERTYWWDEGVVFSMFKTPWCTNRVEDITLCNYDSTRWNIIPVTDCSRANERFRYFEVN